MRIVQRNGRIDRIGSPHADVFVHCFMPDTQLDSILRLEVRLQHKIAQANAGVGVESTVIPGSATREQVFVDAEIVADEKADQVRRLAEGDSAVLDELDRDDAYSGEEFREELRVALLSEAGDDLRMLPWGIGSGHDQGPTSAIVFLAKAGKRHYFRVAPIESNDAPIVDDLLQALKIARCTANTPRKYPNELRSIVYEAWKEVRGNLHAWLQAQRDPARRHGPLPKAQRDAIDLLQRVASDDAARAVQALATRWPADVEKDLRAVLRDPALTDDERIECIVQYVFNRGLRPIPPEAVPDIRLDDVKLVAYQVVTR
jgi:hypothetical protein